MNILCFGDSNTYGYKPDGTGRFDTDTRWTSLLQKKLGADHRVIEEGLCGRTTVFQDDLREGRRGLDLIGVTMEMHNPIDLLIVMLGTNDCKTRYNASAGTIAKGLAQVIQKARKNASQPFDLLVISPIHLGEGVGDPGFDPEFNEKSVEVSKKLAEEYHKVALLHHAAFWMPLLSHLRVQPTASIWMQPVTLHLLMQSMKKLSICKKNWKKRYRFLTSIPLFVFVFFIKYKSA